MRSIRPPIATSGHRSARGRTSLAISVVGPVRAEIAGRPVTLRSRKCRAALACLAFSEARQETRERLVGLLWSESGEDKARASLRQILHELGEALAEAGYQGLARERLHVALTGDTSLDCHEVLAMAAMRQVHPRLLDTPLLSETLLRDLDDIDPAFHDWVVAKRQSFHATLLRLLEAGLRDPATQAQQRRQIAQAILNLDPTHEAACRALMRRFAEDGEISSALRAYAVLWNLLDEEYGIEPSAPTQHLVADIKRGLIEARLPPPAATLSRHPRLASVVPWAGAFPHLGIQFLDEGMLLAGPV